jgi:hypothetical protein
MGANEIAMNGAMMRERVFGFMGLVFWISVGFHKPFVDRITQAWQGKVMARI